MIKQAELSSDKIYRYSLARCWKITNRFLTYIMLNPSIADAEVDDATIRVCCGRAKLLGYKGIVVYNLFALRSVSPKELYNHSDPIGPSNNRYLENRLKELYRQNEPVIIAWGNHGSFKNRDKEFLEMSREYNTKLLALKITKSGQPAHPLRISYNQDLIPYN